MSNYIQFSKEIENRIQEDRLKHVINPYAFPDEKVVRRNESFDQASLLRPAFVRDCDKIINVPFYTRYTDKTQVFSLVKNDDITRRSVHVQLVSRIARNIGRALNLNLDLIEAISLGHDIGHTPFGHAGEYKLNEIYNARTGRRFNHNIHSARVLDRMFPLNLSLQTLDGIICHNGEIEMQKYEPKAYYDFETFDKKMNECYINQKANYELVPATLEACVMRVSDIIAYLGKDRHDAIKLHLLPDDSGFQSTKLGKINAEIIHNMTVNLIEKSYGKPYLQMDEDFYEAFSRSKAENYELIYNSKENQALFDTQLYPMFEEIYEKLYQDFVSGNKESVIYRHHIQYMRKYTQFCSTQIDYEAEDPNDIVVDYIAGMTDDYFVDLYDFLFPKGKYQVHYKGYFGE